MSRLDYEIISRMLKYDLNAKVCDAMCLFIWLLLNLSCHLILSCYVCHSTHQGKFFFYFFYFQGILAYRSGDYEECIKYLEASVSRNPSLILSTALLGNAYYFTGKQGRLQKIDTLGLNATL